MNYLMEPKGAAVPFGMYQDLGISTEMQNRHNRLTWSKYQAGNFSGAITYVAAREKPEVRQAIYAYLRQQGVSQADVDAFRKSVNNLLTQAGAAPDPGVGGGPNYLLWGGIALAVVAGGYFLFFRKKGRNK